VGSRKCKNEQCGKRFKVPNDTPPYVRWCNDECKIEVGVQEVQKARRRAERASKAAIKKKKKEHSSQKRKLQQENVKTREKAARSACHKYIRERDKNDNCICCDKPLGETYHAGHFLPSGNNSILRYDEFNIHAQRVDCNYFRGGDSGDYERNLRKKIGDEKVDRLLSMRGHGPVKRTAEDYSEIEQYFKRKLALLSRE
jgi:hypothetical protein